MVWAGISRGGRTYLHIVMRGIITGVRYRYEILDVYVRPGSVMTITILPRRGVIASIAVHPSFGQPAPA